METAGHFETRYLNRMTAMLQSAFDQACAEGDILTAEELLGALETVLTRAATRDEHRERSMSVLPGGGVLSCRGAAWRLRHRGVRHAAYRSDRGVAGILRSVL